MHPEDETIPDKQNSVARQKPSLSDSLANWILRFSLSSSGDSCPTHTVRFHLIRGRILLGLGQYDHAISDFRNALMLDWRHEEAAFWLSKARYALQHSGESGSLHRV